MKENEYKLKSVLVKDHGLSSRAMRILTAAKIFSIKDFENTYGGSWLLKFPGCGKKTYNEIRTFALSCGHTHLSKYGY